MMTDARAPDRDGIAALASVLRGGGVVAFTGAGVSTASGIPDFRSPGGLWTRYDPTDFTFSRYVASAQTRQRAWTLRRELWARAPQPNPAHHALADLEHRGLLNAVVTQNIDGLHTDAGSQRVIEVHGTARQVMCIGTAARAGNPAGCGWRADTTWALARVEAGEPDPACPDCGGLLKSAAISFGQNVAPAVLAEAKAVTTSARTLLAVGSSLRVQPAAGLPDAAAQAGVRLVVVNREPTPADCLAEIVVHGEAGPVLSAAVAALGRAVRP